MGGTTIAQDRTFDRVVLENGQEIQGEIVEYEPNSHVIIEAENGQEYRYIWALIKRVERAKETEEETEEADRTASEIEDDDLILRPGDQVVVVLANGLEIEGLVNTHVEDDYIVIEARDGGTYRYSMAVIEEIKRNQGVTDPDFAARTRETPSEDRWRIVIGAVGSYGFGSFVEDAGAGGRIGILSERPSALGSIEFSIIYSRFLNIIGSNAGINAGLRGPTQLVAGELGFIIRSNVDATSGELQGRIYLGLGYLSGQEFVGDFYVLYPGFGVDYVVDTSIGSLAFGAWLNTGEAAPVFSDIGTTQYMFGITPGVRLDIRL